jgi:protein tyrosine/serine phosphatase
MFFRTNLRAAATIALTAALALPSSLSAGARSTATGAGATATVLPRIENFGRVDDGYYRGAQPEGGDFAELATLGVKTVIDLTGDDYQPNEQRLTEAAGMHYVRIPMTTHQPPTAQQLSTFFGIIDDPASIPVYVHCVGGRHRTGVMTAAYRMATDGWSADRAFQEMKQYKFGADFLHAEFKAFVYGYRPELVEHASASLNAPDQPALAGSSHEGH